MTVGIRFADQAGWLGSAETARLGRIAFIGNLTSAAPQSFPNLNFTATPPTWSGNGVVLVAPVTYGGYRVWQSGISNVTWNNTTKVLSTTVTTLVMVVLFAETTPTAGSVGLQIVNANGEVLIDNVSPLLEVVASGTHVATKGSVFAITQPPGYSNMQTFIRWGINTDFIIPGNNGTGYVGFVNGGFGSSFNIDYKIVAYNPTTSRGSGTGPVLAFYNGGTGICLFSSYREYARVRTALPIEQTDFFDGGAGGASFYYHNTVPSDCFLGLQPSYRLAGDLGCGFIRVSTGQLTSALLNGFTSGNASSLGISTLPSYPGAWMNTNLVLNP